MKKMDIVMMTIALIQLVAELVRTWRELMQPDLQVRPNCM